MTGRLLLVEDDPRLGPLVRSLLADDWDVLLCTSAELAQAELGARSFDVAVIDRRLPGLSGLDLVRGIRANRLGMPILLLTALGTVTDIVEGLDAGANDYLVKPFEVDELRARLRALTRSPVDDGGISIGSWTFFPRDAAIESPYAGRILLTPTESALLATLASDPARTFSRQHLLRAVFPSGDRPTTVETYVHYVRRKTEPDLIVTVRRHGYRLGTPA